MRKSIFERLEQRFSNPLDEYVKISSFLRQKACYYSHTINECFSTLFSYCNILRKHYTDFEDCISKNIGILEHYFSYIGNETFNGFNDSSKEDILDSFLTYLEIIECMLCVFDEYADEIWDSSYIDESIINQAKEMIDESLKSINYKIEEKSTSFVKIIKIDPVSEYVAQQSEPNMKTAIMNYLAVRDNNIEEKERSLHDLIDLLEPSFKKFKTVEIINKASEFSQVIRHPEIKKDEKEYQWFFKNKRKFLDELFSLCIFTQQYVLNKRIAESLESKKWLENNDRPN